MKPTCSPLEMKRGMNPTDKREKGEFDLNYLELFKFILNPPSKGSGL